MRSCRALSVLLLIGLITALFTGCSQTYVTSNTDLNAVSISVGDHIRWGSYPQQTDKPEPIEWRVLDVKDGKALVISENLLDCRKYHNKYKEITWEKCSLRKWLNNDFLNSAFTKSEQSVIASVTIENHDNNTGISDSGEDTKDRIFCLSVYEASIYFSGNEDRKAFPTSYAVNNGSYVHFDEQGIWWLRTPGYTNYAASCVDVYGEINKDGTGAEFDDVSVRPVFWMELPNQ